MTRSYISSIPGINLGGCKFVDGRFTAESQAEISVVEGSDSFNTGIVRVEQDAGQVLHPYAVEQVLSGEKDLREFAEFNPYPARGDDLILEQLSAIRADLDLIKIKLGIAGHPEQEQETEVPEPVEQEPGTVGDDTKEAEPPEAEPPEVSDAYSRLSALTVDKLKATASNRDVKLKSGASKHEIIRTLILDEFKYDIGEAE